MMLMMMMMGDDADADNTQRSQDNDLVCLSPTTKMNQSWSKPEGKMGYNGGTVWGTIVCNMGYNRDDICQKIYATANLGP